MFPRSGLLYMVVGVLGVVILWAVHVFGVYSVPGRARIGLTAVFVLVALFGFMEFMDVGKNYVGA